MAGAGHTYELWEWAELDVVYRDWPRWVSNREKKKKVFEDALVTFGTLTHPSEKGAEFISAAKGF